MKQKQQGCAHNHEHRAPQRRVDVTSSNKRRRQKKDELELQYTSATIQKTLADVGRPIMNITTRDRRERAFQLLGTVNMDGCKVVTSLDIDEYEMNVQALDGDQATSSNAGNCDDQDLASMYVIAGLVQSTRQYYSSSLIYKAASISGGGVGPNSPSCNEDQPTKKQTKSMTEVSTINLNDERLSEDNSEGLSSWTPSSSSFNHYDSTIYKIDNDNKSDGQSSYTAVWSSSSSLPSSLSVDSASSATSPQCQGGDSAKETRKESCARTTEEGGVSIIG